MTWTLFRKPVDFTETVIKETVSEKSNLCREMTWTEIILYVIFIVAVCAFALLGVMRTETSGSRLQMTDQEVSQVMGNLEKRSAGDCVLTRTDDGNFKCKEMATGKVYRVKVQ